MTDLDFIPPVIHLDAKRRRSARSQVVWGIGLACVMALWLSMHRMEVTRASEQLESARVEQQQLSDRQRFYDMLMAERRQLNMRADVQDAANDRASLVTVMAELGALLPEGALLTELTLESPMETAAVVTPSPAVQRPGNAPTTTAPPQTVTWPRLRIVGAAPSNVLVSTFTARLGGSPLFRDVQTGTVRDGQLAGRQVRVFSAECFVVPQMGGSR